MRSFQDDSDPFLAHAGFLRRLARELVRDVHDREDLLQEAWAAASAAGAGGTVRPLHLRAWLARVLRNRAAGLQRERARRAEREREVAREEALDVSVERELGVQERVLAAVSALREPYRTAIVLRYYRDLEPAAIARELGIPVATVDSRLLRARALLRERLTRELGDRRAWIAALLPLCRSSSSSAPVGLATGPFLWMGVAGMKLWIALCAAAVVAVGIWQWPRTQESARPTLEAPQAPPEVLAAPATSVLPPPAVEGQGRAPVEAPLAHEPEARPAEPAAPRGHALRGTVLDQQGIPLASAGVRFTAFASGAAVTTSTDPGGRFELVGLAGEGRALVDEPGWTTIVAGALVPGVEAGETTIVAAPACELAVRVVDEARRALPGVRVRVALPAALGARYEQGLERSELLPEIALTDGEGACAVTAPLVPGATLELHKEGFEALAHPLEPGGLSVGGSTSLTLVLRSLAARERTLAGRVVDAVGEGVEDARVELGTMGTRTDDEGWFRFDLSEGDPFRNWMGPERLPTRITAARAGFLPAVLQAELDADGGTLWPEPLVLQITAQTLAISGHVLDQDGRAIEDAIVFLPEAHLIAGETTIEAVMRGETGEEFLQSERSGEDGHFEFHGLLDQPYDIAAYQEDTLLRGDARAVAAGTSGVEIRIDTRDLWREVRGRVVTRDGRPLAGIELTPSMTTQQARGSTGHWMTGAWLPSTKTDPAGEFVLRDVPRQHMTAALSGAEIMHADGLTFTTDDAREDEHGNLKGCVLVATLRLRFQIVLDDPAEADSFRVLDESGGELMPFMQMVGRYASSDEYSRLTEGRSMHLFVAQDARTIVLQRGGNEVRRIPIELAAGEELRVR